MLPLLPSETNLVKSLSELEQTAAIIKDNYSGRRRAVTFHENVSYG